MVKKTQKYYCEECGVEVDINAEICEECGNPIIIENLNKETIVENDEEINKLKEELEKEKAEKEAANSKLKENEEKLDKYENKEKIKEEKQKKIKEIKEKTKQKSLSAVRKFRIATAVIFIVSGLAVIPDKEYNLGMSIWIAGTGVAILPQFYDLIFKYFKTEKKTKWQWIIGFAIFIILGLIFGGVTNGAN